MSRTKKIIMIIGLLILFLIPTNVMAKTEETTWTDEATGIQFKISVDENGNVKANPIGEQTWLNNVEDYKKYREALTRAQIQAKVIDESGNAGDNTTTKEEGQEERKETTTTTGTATTPNNTRDISNVSKSSLGWGGNLFCIEHYNNNIAEGNGKNKVTVAGRTIDLSTVTNDGIKIGEGKTPKTGTVTATPTQPSQGMVLNDAKYTVESKETVGITYESAAIAYIASRVNDANDNGNALENYMQIAIWDVDYFKLNGEATGRFSGGLLEEAKAYQTFRKEVENWESKNKNIIKDNIVNKTVSTDIKKGEQKLRTIYIRIC